VAKARNPRTVGQQRAWSSRLLRLFSADQEEETERLRLLERDHVNEVLEAAGPLGKAIKAELQALEAAQESGEQ